MQGRLHNHCCGRKAISITYSECVFVALVIQLAMPMRHIVLSSVACPALSYFSTLCYKSLDFQLDVTEREMCVWLLSHSEKNGARYYHKCTSTEVCM